MTYTYFVSYAIENGFGNCWVERSEPIVKGSIPELQEHISENQAFRGKVVVLYYASMELE